MDRYIPKVLGLSAKKAAGIYLLFGVIWITTTDWIVLQLAVSESQYSLFQSVKGWLFVGLSTLLLFGLVRFREKQVTFAAERLSVALEQLKVIHRVFRHNLRNELTVFRGYVNTAASSIQDERLKRQLSLADEAAGRIGQLNEALRKVENPRYSTETAVDVVPILESECAVIAEETGIDVGLELVDQGHIIGDESVGLLIREILLYLADLHRDPEASAGFRVELTRGDRQLIVSVRAPGLHIPDSELAPIQAGEEAPLFHASGVQLWVIKWLANYYGGEIELDVSDDASQISVGFSELHQVDQYAISAREQIDTMVQSTAT